MSRTPSRRSVVRDGLRATAGGAFLLEALVALLIFSFGLLAMAGLHAQAIRHFNDAQYRADAADLVHGTLSLMRASDPATLAARFDPPIGAEWTVLLDHAKRLPGVSDSRNVPTLEFADGPTAGSRQASLHVFWQATDDSPLHTYGAAIVVGSN